MDFFARNQLTMPLQQQKKQFHGDFFQRQEAVATLQPITGLVESEIAEMEFLGRKSPTCRLPKSCPMTPIRSNWPNDLRVQQNFISSS